jgi:hypothetical protein
LVAGEWERKRARVEDMKGEKEEEGKGKKKKEEVPVQP